MIKTIRISYNCRDLASSLGDKIKTWKDKEYCDGNIIEVIDITRYQNPHDLDIWFNIEYTLTKDLEAIELEERLKIGL